MLDQLCLALTKGNQHEAVTRNRKRLEWAVIPLEKAEDFAATLKAILKYDTLFGKTPDSLKALEDFVGLNPKGDQELVHNEAILMQEGEQLAELEVDCEDVDTLIEKVITQARDVFHHQGLQRFNTILAGTQDTKGKAIKGPDAAKDWLRGWWARDLSEAPRCVSGPLHENTEHVKEQLAEYLNATDQDRVLTGFPQIDNYMVIRRNKFLAIIGQSGDGKTTFLNSMVYNMALQGKNILYISLEFSPKEMWEQFAFLHTSYFSDRFRMPSISDWQQKRVLNQDVDNMMAVIDDIQNRTVVAGLIDVQQFTVWDDIENYLKANHAKNKYDVLVVDYFGDKFELPGVNVRTPQDRDNGVNEIIGKAVRLSHTFDNDRGILVISPTQVTKEASKAAHKAKKTEDIAAYDIDSIHTYKAMRYDIDLAIGVYSDDDMKDDFLSEINCVKWRGTEKFPRFQTQMEPSSKYVRQYTSCSERQIQTDRINSQHLLREEL
jgi:energy-coupling factor transporter ATP-binding protein EcfA2